MLGNYAKFIGDSIKRAMENNGEQNLALRLLETGCQACVRKGCQACVIVLMYPLSLSRNSSEFFSLAPIFPICRLTVEESRRK